MKAVTQKRKTQSIHNNIDSFLVKKARYSGHGGDLKAETESEIMASQPEALQTKHNSTYILRSETRKQMQTTSII